MATSDYSVYLPSGSITDAWGACVTASGHTRIKAGQPYPPGRHPVDHALSWERGRVLHEYQVVYISEGQGRFESKTGGKRQITAGSAFLLFPDVWHRYEPLRETGWVEDWLEMKGPTIDRLAREKVVSARRSVLRVSRPAEVLELFSRCHELARTTPGGYQPVLGVLGLQILAQILSATATVSRSAENGPEDAIRRGQSLIAQSVDRPIRMDQIAEDVGMSYSYFRRAFKARTGVSPKQYHLQLRLRKTQNLLATTAMSVKQIAELLGFDSPFHLSADFKSRVGYSPTQWRLRG